MRIAALLLALAAVACTTVAAADPSVATFTIEGKSVTLVAGRAEVEAAPGSASKIVTQLGTERATGDLDADGRPDTAVTLTQQPGGSGTFSYVAVLLNPASGSAGTNAIRIGDRIKITGLRLDGGAIVVEYLDRAPSEPFTTAPSVASTKRFVIKNGKLEG